MPLNVPVYASARSRSVEKPSSWSSLAENRSRWPASMIRRSVVPERGGLRMKIAGGFRSPVSGASSRSMGTAARNRATSASVMGS